MAIQRDLGGNINVFNSSSMACSSILAYQRKFPRLSAVRWVEWERKSENLRDVLRKKRQDKL